MKAYIIKRHNKYFGDFGTSLFGSVILTIGLIVAPYHIIVIIGLVAVPFYAWFIYTLQRYIEFKRDRADYEALVISENGIKYKNEKETVCIAWDDISEIVIRKAGESRWVWAELDFFLYNNRKKTFSLEPYMRTINIYRLRKAIRFFGKREDIVATKYRLWLIF